MPSLSTPPYVLANSLPYYCCWSHCIHFRSGQAPRCYSRQYTIIWHSHIFPVQSMLLPHSCPQSHPFSVHHGLCQEYSLFARRMPIRLRHCESGGCQWKEPETSTKYTEYTGLSGYSSMRPHRHIQHAKGTSLAAGDVAN